MEKIIKAKNEIMLGAVGIAFLLFLIFVFFWTINFLAANFSKSFTSAKGGETTANFDLNGAKRLNLKGLGSGAASQN